MNRREFIKSTALICAAIQVAPSVLLPAPTLASQVKVKCLGLTESYRVLRYQLWADHPTKGRLEAYCDIDAELLKLVGSKREYIKDELSCVVEAMEYEWRRRQ